MPNTTSITPTIGRKVYLWINEEVYNDFGASIADQSKPFDASIAYVHPNGKINVSFVDHEGELMGALHKLEIRDPSGGEAHLSYYEPFCTWMPYQVDQAKQVFAEAKAEEAHK